MMRLVTSLSFIALAGISQCSGFAPLGVNVRPIAPTKLMVSSSMPSEFPTFDKEEQTPQESEAAPEKKKIPSKAKHGESGLFSPIVLLVKDFMGNDKDFNKLRAKAISIHSDVISSFVNTSENAVGQTVLKTLFRLADADKNGFIEEGELRSALNLLGFDWLQGKQVAGILKRADKDENGVLDIDEWMSEAPKTLRTNLIKLAKKNGGELGFLV